MAGWRFWVLLTLTIWMSMLRATFGIPFVRTFWLGLQTLREGSCLKLLVLVVFGWKLVKAAITTSSGTEAFLRRRYLQMSWKKKISAETSWCGNHGFLC